MPVSIRPFLMLWSALLLSGSDPAPRAGVGADPASHQVSSIAIAPDPIPTIEAMPPGAGWPWRISEAANAEEESDEGDDLGSLRDDSSRRRFLGHRSDPAPARPDRGSFRSPFRSPILRC